MSMRTDSPIWARDLGFFIVAGVLIGLGTWSSTGLTGLDESIHSFRSAIETHAHGEWWTPTLEGELRVRKPPLLYWLMGLSFSLFGVSFFSGRLPVVLMGALLVLLTRQIARQLGRDDAVLVGWLALATFAVASESRRAMLDVPVAVCTALAVLLALQAWSRQQAWPLYPAAMAAAAGAMFKGPVIAVFLGAAALAAWLAPPLGGPGVSRRAWIAPLLLAALLAAVWPLSMLLSHADLLPALADDLEDRQLSWPGLKSIGQVLSGSLAIALPWSFVLVAGLAGALRSARLPQDRALRWLLLWLALALLPFMFIRTFERYLVPLIPVLALLLGHVLSDPRRLGVRFGLGMTVLLLAIPTLAFAAMAWRFEQAWLLPMTSLLALAAAAVFAIRLNVLALARASALTLALALGAVYPLLGISRFPVEVAALLESYPAAHYRQPHPGVASIHLARSLPVLQGSDRLEGFDGVLIVPEAEWSQLMQDAATTGLTTAELARFRSFHARTQFIRFARPDARRADWVEAFRSGDWQPLKPGFVVARVAAPGSGLHAPPPPLAPQEF